MTSPPVDILVLAPPLPPSECCRPIVSIYAPDPIAVAGTNFLSFTPVQRQQPGICGGANTATFLDCTSKRRHE